MTNLVLIGCAPCLREDLANLPAIQADYMAIGLDAVDKYYGEIRYIATNHKEDIPTIQRLMQERHESCGGNHEYLIIAPEKWQGVDIVETYRPPSGSSALTGALAAIRLGYERIILCGCPLTGNAPEGNPYEAFRPGWEAKKDELIGKVKSMSGWTRELLGGPEDWNGPRAKITIGACWDGRDYYSPEYVNILYRAAARNITVPFDFVLYYGPEAMRPGRLDALDQAIRTVPSELPSWWGAMRFWQPNPRGIETDTILYLDLDQVIVGNLDDLIDFPSNLACMKDWPAHCCPSGREKDACVSATLLRNGAGAKVWEEYVRCGMPTWDPLSTVDRGCLPEAAQTIINEPRNGIAVDLFPENWVASYKLAVLGRGMPEDCRIVSMHGRPKPHELVHHEDFVLEHWQ